MSSSLNKRESFVRRLDDHVVSKIRSSIVISSLAQVLSELVQNSVDAQATRVDARIDVNAWSVQTVDNGNGITFEDLHHVGKRYSTSKFHSEKDFHSKISTYGFRGEALSSIAECAMIEITSRHFQSTQAFKKLIQAGKEVLFEPAPSFQKIGTQITAKNIFFNMPVKRKCLVIGQELEKAKQQMTYIAMINPLISFNLTDFVKPVPLVTFPRSQTIISRFCSVYGEQKREFLSEVSVEVSHKKFEISGYLSHPTFGTHNKDLQFLYVNNHFVKKTPIHSLINKRYSDLLEKRDSAKKNSSIPMFLLQITCPPSLYDITFNPCKTQVEFRDWESFLIIIENIIKDLFSKLLSHSSHKKSSSFAPNSKEPNLPEYARKETRQSSEDTARGNYFQKSRVSQRERELNQQCQEGLRWRAGSSTSMMHRGYEEVPRCKTEVARKWINQAFAPPEKAIPTMAPGKAPFWQQKENFSNEFTITKEMIQRCEVINQLDTKFIVCKIDDLVVVIDQHAAGERIKLEEFEDQFFGDGGCRDKKIRIEFLSHSIESEMTLHEISLLKRFQECLESWGWSFTFSGGLSVLLHSVPTVLGVALESEGPLKEFLSELEESGGSQYLKPKSIVRVLQSKACRSAIMFGDVLSFEQCSQIVQKLKKCRAPFTCAHGRPSIHPLLDLSLLRKYN